jgi:hypothetical protein
LQARACSSRALFWVFIGLFLVGLFFLPLLLLVFPLGLLVLAGLIHHAVMVVRAERLNQERPGGPAGH